MKRETTRVQIVTDRFDTPIPVPVDNVAAVALGEQFGVQTRVMWPRFGEWPHAHEVC